MVRVLGKSTSINVRKVLWTCDELGIAFEQEDWGNGHRSTHLPEFVARNPNRLVPVLEDGELVLWESNVIIRYLASRYGEGVLLPNLAADRALVELWMDWQATEFNNSWRYAFGCLVRQEPSAPDPDRLDQSLEDWTRHIAILDAQLQKTGGYVAGESFTLADIPVGLAVNRWFMTPWDRPDFELVSDYYERLSERPAFRTHGRNGIP